MKRILCLSLVALSSLGFAGESISLDKIRMNVVSTDACGVVNEQTLFNFSESNGVVTADYAGGKIRRGFLVGRYTQENHLEFSYCQMQIDGKLDNGVSQCDVAKDNTGKVTLTEHFEWASRPGEFGTNVFKEIP